MGGREVGGLASQLAAHMDFSSEEIDRVQRFWNSPRIAGAPGLKAVDLFHAVDSGQIKVLWVMATNPAVSLPDSNTVRRALEKCPTVIVSDVCHTDTTDFGDILLPAEAWSEKDGTVTNSERCVSRQKAFKVAPGLAKPDWWAMTEVAKALGYRAHFNYRSAHDIFVEHARLSGFENAGTRGFDISGLSAISAQNYDSLKPIQWPVTDAKPNGTARMFEDGRFFTKSGRAQFISNAPTLAQCSSAELVLNTGRVRDQWHTMTRTGLAPTLTTHCELPFVQIHPQDAKKNTICDRQFALLKSSFGQFIARVEVSNEVTQGQLFSPIHWTQQFGKNAVVSRVVSPETDPISGQPESKASAVTIQAYECDRWLRVMSRQPIERTAWAYCLETKVADGFSYVLGTDEPVDWRQWALQSVSDDVDLTHYENPLSGSTFITLSTTNQTELILSVQSNAADLPSLLWIQEAFQGAVSDLRTRVRGEFGAADKLICGCFKTSEKTIQRGIEAGHHSVSQLASEFGCGSKCGSCRPEINRLIEQAEF